MLQNRLFIIVVLFGTLFIFADRSTAKPTLTVTNLNDSGAGSLRHAVTFANEEDEIDFAVAGTIVLTSGPIVIWQRDLTISGSGANQLFIDGNGSTHIFEVDPIPGDTPDHWQVTITNVTIQNGFGTNGGGVVNRGGVEFSQVVFEGNTAVQNGGAVYNEAGLAISESTLVNNSAQSGGGIYNAGGLAIEKSVLFDNHAQTGDGGGLQNQEGVSIVNSTFSQNTAVNGNGGSIASSGGAALQFNTIVENEAGETGGGLYINGAATTLGFNIIANNIAPQEPDISTDADAVLFSQGYNLVKTYTAPSTFTFPVSTDILLLDPELNPLAANGGATMTHALKDSSPAINAIPGTECEQDKDQRNYLRPDSLDCDIGAFEKDGPTPPTLLPFRFYLPYIFR